MLRCCGVFYDLDLVFCEVVELVDELVDLPVCGLNLALEERLLVASFGVGQLLVQLQHVLYELDHSIVSGHVFGVGKVDGADGVLL